MRAFALILYLCFIFTPAMAQDEPAVVHVISEDMGGTMLDFIAKYVTWERHGDSIRVEGPCVSACTLLLGIFPTEKVCATRNAEFAFHSASIGMGGPYTEEGTRLAWFFYHGRTERVLAAHGWTGPTEHPDLIIIDAQEIVRPCNWEDYHGK